MIVCDASCAAVGIAVLNRKNDRRSVQALRDSRGCQTDHPPMPALACNDYKLSCAKLFGFEKRELGDLLLNLLTLAVPAVEDRRQCPRLSEIFTLEKLDDMLCNVHSSGGVYPRGDSKADVVARHLRRTIGDFHQRFQTVVLCIWKISQPESDDRAILSREIHDVGDSSDRSDLQKRGDEMFFFFFAKKRVSELEGDTDPGEMFIGVLTVRLIRIYNRKRVRIASYRVGDVVIGDDEVQPIFLRPGDRLEASNPAVDAYYNLASVGLGFLERRYVYSITFGKSVRDVKRSAAAENLESLAKEHGTRRAVDIVITPDQDLLAVVDGFENARDCFAHSF